MNLRQALRFEALPFIVEFTDANGPCHAWEPNAAFNVDTIAENYAKACGRDNPQFIYRVLMPSCLGGFLEILRVEGTISRPYPRGKLEIAA